MDPWRADNSASQPMVFVGLWTNWSRGPVFGRTLTLERRDADLLIAFTAFFVALVGSRFWRLLCLFLHRRYSTSGPHDALHNQRQAILRNSSSAEAGVLSFAELYWSWRHSIDTSKMFELGPVLRRVLLAFAMAIVCVCSFAVASGFSSSISTGISDEVLVNGANCGILPEPGNIQMNSTYTAIASWMSTRLYNAQNYAQQCYSANRSTNVDCASFVTKRLSTIADHQAPCPFAKRLCRSDTANLLLDTGYINSHDDMGMNSPREKRLLARRVLHCAPLVTEGHTSTRSTSTMNSTRYHYGTILDGTESNITAVNYTIEVSDKSWQFKNRGKRGDNYRLSSEVSMTFDGSFRKEWTSFIPEPGLRRSDGDIVIIFLVGNGVAFSQPIEDDWYRATTPAGKYHIVTQDEELDMYSSDEAASPMGCVQQYQYCNAQLPGESGCGPLASWYDSITGAMPHFNTTEQQFFSSAFPELNDIATQFNWYVGTLGGFPSDLSDVFGGLKALSLSSQQLLANGVSAPLPPNQWQIDVTHWWSITLAASQAAFVETTYGQNDPDLQPVKLVPPESQRQRLCNNQKMRSTRHGSFSTFGLLFTYITGIIIIVASLTSEPIIACLHRRKKYQQFKHLEWTANGVLQLQRQGYEGAGVKGWSHCTDNVPTTDPDEIMPFLNVSDIEHPKLSQGKRGDNLDGSSTSEGQLGQQQSSSASVALTLASPSPRPSSPRHSSRTPLRPKIVIPASQTPTATSPMATELDEGAGSHARVQAVTPQASVEMPEKAESMFNDGSAVVRANTA